ncbi:alpha/beta hydrolase family protein [Nocardia sp. NPDC004068]|uniref:alpha/beta hydrolase family protein n=1 Tax=Nocardia sp. NPDC004068 TaxID=3364303 RepID=UPI0036BA2EFE
MPVVSRRRMAAVVVAVGLWVGGAVPAAVGEGPGEARLSGVGVLDPRWGFAAAAAGIEIGYGTTDQWGRAARGSGALYLPHGVPPVGGWPVVVWAHGTVGIGDGCAPSRRPQSERNSAYLNRVLDRGYAVLAPDYQGLGTEGQFSYYNSAVEGASILDAVAALRTVPVPLSGSWAIVGQSEGAHAAMSAAGRYADSGGGAARGLRAVVATGLRTDPPHSLRAMFRRGSTGAQNQVGYAAYFLAALRELAPERVTPYLSDFGRDYVEAAATQCLSDLVARAAGRRPADLVADPDHPTPTFDADIAALTGYRDHDLPADILLGYGTADIDVPPTGTDAYAAALRAANRGIGVTVESYPGADHSGAFLASLPDALAFLDAHLR